MRTRVSSLGDNANLDPEPMDKKQCKKELEKPPEAYIFAGPDTWEDEDMKMAKKLGELEQTNNERSCFTIATTTEYLSKQI
jgi:hypothetical protein